MIPSPRSIGHALADLAKPRVLRGQRYLDEWRALAVAGVPPHELRHALDRDVHQTAAMDALKSWDGRGCLALIGALESGKSHAAALWLLAGVRLGRQCVWVSSSMLLSWTDVEIAMTRATSADRFVFDDGGVGTITQTPAFAEKLEAVLHARHSKGKPTIITSNSNQAHFEEIVGPRVLSRMKAAGEIVEIAEELDLRAAESEGIAEETGHGDRWRRARRIVDVFGVTLDDRFDEETNRVERRTRVGDGLDSRNLDARQLEQLAAEYLIPWAEVLAKAEEDERALDKEAAGLMRAVEGMQSGAGARAGTLAKIIKRADNDVRLAKLEQRAVAITPVAVGPVPPPFEGKPGEVALRRLGYRVKPLGDGFRTHWWDGAKLVPKSDKLPSERDAWDFAAGLQGMGW
jgi:hypothetical protein